jgi:hypothetical protein
LRRPHAEPFRSGAAEPAKAAPFAGVVARALAAFDQKHVQRRLSPVRITRHARGRLHWNGEPRAQAAKVTPFDAVVERALAAFDQKN